MVRCMLVLILTLLSGCSAVEQNTSNGLESSSFEAQDTNTITQVAGEAMDKVKSYRMQGRVKRYGVVVTFDLQVKKAGCAGRIGTLDKTYNVAIHKHNGVYYRRNKIWTYQIVNSRNWWAMCKLGLIARNLQNQSTEAGAKPLRSVLQYGETSVLRLSYGSAGFVEMELAKPHRVVKLISPGMKMHFSNFNEDFAIPNPQRALISKDEIDLFKQSIPDPR